MSGLLFLALLMVVVSGLIAYIGDLIGRKMGRKRLTLFGLRPRYTAIIISVAAGMIIAIATLAAAFIISKPVRKAFTEPIEELQAELVESKRQLETEKTRLSDLQRQYADAKRQLQDAQARYDNELASHERLITEKKEQLAAVDRKLKAAEAGLKKSEADLKLYGQKLTGVTRDLDQKRRDVDTLKAQRQDLQNQIDAMRTFVIANFSQLAFASGQEILTGLMPTTRDSLELRRVNLRCFLDAAEQIVRKQCRDLKLGKNETAIVYLQVVNGRTVTISADKAVEIMSNRLANLAGAAPKAIVRLAPENNVAVNGQAFIDVNAVQIIPNTRVFSAGEEVARLTLTVTPQTTYGDILTRLVDELLREHVPNALRKKEVMLILRRFDPAHPDDPPGASPSMVSWLDLATAAEQAQKLSGKVSIIARSSKTMNRFDPLDLSLEVVGSD